MKHIIIITLLIFISCNPTPSNPFKESEAISCEEVKGKCEETGRVCDDRVGTAVCHCDGDTVWGINEQKCIIPETKGGSYHCQCEENAVTTNGLFCIPTCDGYSEECGEFGLECNMEKGHCDSICQGVGSCPDGEGCFSGVCDAID